MLNTYPVATVYHHTLPTNLSTNNINANTRRNGLAASLSLAKYRRSSLSPQPPTTSLIVPQQTFDDFNFDYFSSNCPYDDCWSSVDVLPKSVEPVVTDTSPILLFPEAVVTEPKLSVYDGGLSFLDGLDLANNLIPSQTPSNLFNQRVTYDDSFLDYKHLLDLPKTLYNEPKESFVLPIPPLPIVLPPPPAVRPITPPRGISEQIPSSSSSNIQCVRIIRRNDTAPLLSTETTSTSTNSTQPRRVVRVIRLSNVSRTPAVTTTNGEQSLEQISSTTETPSITTSNVYIVRKADLSLNQPSSTTKYASVHLNPALQHVITKSSTMSNNNTTNTNLNTTNNQLQSVDNVDENSQQHKLYGATISIFGIEYAVVSNEENESTEMTRTLLVQNMNDPSTITKTNAQISNKINDIHKLFSRIYRCVLCSAEFDAYDDFVTHGSGHLQDLSLISLETASVFRRRSYRCLLPNCHTRIESETESPRILDQLFRRHLLSHVGTHPFKCHICKSKFQRIQNYRVHLAYHEEMNSPSLQCKKCLKKFTADKQYNFHVRKCFVVPSSPMTNTLASFQCHLCGENFEKDESLTLHIKHFHPSRLSTPSVSAIRSDNEVRVRLISPPAVSIKSQTTLHSYSCQICHQQFDRRLLYKKHMLSHLGDKHFACTYPGCKDTFYTQSNLDRHMRTVHLRAAHTFSCTFPNCGKTFSRNDSLKNHRAKHFPNMIMKCPYVDCEEKFRVRSTYHAHIKRHRNDKQQQSPTVYVCVLQNCQYTTSNKASMKQHLTKVHDYKQEKDEDIPYVQYPSKQQQQLHVDEPTPANVVDVSAPLVVKLPSEEHVQTTPLVIPHAQTLVAASTFNSTPSLLSSNDPFNLFDMMMLDVPLNNLDWLNIESEETIRPRKRQNIITISRDMESLSTVVVENLSGCARTDYRSNHAVLERAKFRRKLLNYKRELLRVDSQPVPSSTARLSCQQSDENDEEEDILETSTWETSPKRMKRWVDINES